jgi:hypothetical protein
MAKAYRRPKPSLPLDLPGDSDAHKRAISALQARGITPHRPKESQIKVGCWNYYPDRQTLLKDGGKSEKATLAAFLEKVSEAAERPGEPDEFIINLGVSLIS